MESRSTILVVLFVVLLAFAGFFYWTSISKYTKASQLLDRYPAVKNTVNYGLKTVGLPPLQKSINASRVRTKSVSSYRKAFLRSLPVDSLNWVKLFGASGITSEVTFSLKSQTPGQSSPTRVGGTLSLESYKNGRSKAKLSLTRAGRHQFQSATIKAVSGKVYVSIPALGLKVTVPSFLSVPESPIDWGLSRFMSAEAKKSDRTRWRGHDVFRINIQSPDGGILRLYVTRKKPRKLVGAQVIAGNTNWERQFSYSSSFPLTLRTIKTFRDDRLASNIQFRKSGETRIVEITSPDAYYTRRIVLRFPRRSGKTLRADLLVKPAYRSDPLELGVLELAVKDGIPARFQFDLTHQGSDSLPVRLSGTLKSRRLNWVREPSTVTIDDSGVRAASPLELARKVARGNLLRLARQRSGDTGGGRTEGSGPPRQSPSEAQSTDAQAPPESAAPDERGRIGETEAQRTKNGRPDTRRESESGGSVPYPELVRAPAESGETIYRSKHYNFPYTEPPMSYQEAQDHYYSGEFDQAREKLQKLLARFPKSVNVNYLLGVIHYNLGHPEKSRKFFERVFHLRHDPQLRVWSKHYLVELGDTSVVTGK